MTLIRQLFGTSVGLKCVMAVTGLALVGFVIAHMIGNLLVFAGPDAINAYAEGIQGTPALLWTARAGLLAVFLVHMGAAAKLSRANHDARPIRYTRPGTVKASLASRTMLRTGLLLLVYTAYHIAHFTLHAVHYDGSYVDSQGRHDVYNMVVRGFAESWLVSGLYVAAQIALCFHLSHGVASLFQSVGLKNERYGRTIASIGYVVAAVVVAGNVAIVLAARFGVLEVIEGAGRSQ